MLKAYIHKYIYDFDTVRFNDFYVIVKMYRVITYVTYYFLTFYMNVYEKYVSIHSICPISIAYPDILIKLRDNRNLCNDLENILFVLKTIFSTR